MAKTSSQMVVKNRRLKMSPGGIITLPPAARKALGMEKKQGCRVTVAVNNNAVQLVQTNKTGGFRVSPKGQLELRGEARTALESGIERHYWLELDDLKKNIKLRPFEK